MSNIRNKLKDKTSKLNNNTVEDSLHPAKQFFEQGDFKIIPVDLINPDPNQPRKIFDQAALEELSESIKNNGILQPIIVRIDSTDNKIWLVAGERRYRASKMAGLIEIPTIISKGNPAEIALIENIQREDLNPIEEALAYERMIDEFGYTQTQLSNIVGKVQSNISDTLRLAKLPDEIKEECIKTKFQKSFLIEISKIDSDKQIETFKSYLKGGFINKNKTSKGPKEKSISSKIDILINKIDNTIKTLKKMDLNKIDDDEKTRILEKYSVFYEYIEKILRP